MDAPIMIDFAGGTAATSPVRVVPVDASFVLQANAQTVAAIAGFTSIAILPDGISFATAVGGVFEGTLTMVLQWSGADPQIALDNLVPGAHGGPATISWPTPTGEETQILSPGTPLTLTGIVGS